MLECKLFTLSNSFVPFDKSDHKNPMVFALQLIKKVDNSATLLSIPPPLPLSHRLQHLFLLLLFNRPVYYADVNFMHTLTPRLLMTTEKLARGLQQIMYSHWIRSIEFELLLAGLPIN